MFLIKRTFQTTSQLASSNVKLLSKLRQKTSYPLSECRKALNKFDNDIKSAEKWLREEATKKGWSKAQKLSSRDVSQGLIGLTSNEKSSIIVEVNCETDFVARTASFQKLVALVAQTCLHSLPSDRGLVKFSSEEMLILPNLNGKTVADDLAIAVGEVGERIALRRAIGMTSMHSHETIGYYSHAPWLDAPKKFNGVELGRFAGLARIINNNPDRSLNYSDLLLWSRQICQHIVGLNPERLGDIDVDKPHPNKDDETLLAFQDFLLDDSLSVHEWLSKHEMSVKEFVRIQCGEDLDEEHGGMAAEISF